MSTAVVGVGAGLTAVAFRLCLEMAEDGRGDLLRELHRYPAWGWAVLPLVGLGIGWVVGWMVMRFSPDAAGSGIPHVKGVLLRVREMRWRSLLPVKFIGGVLGVGAGLSLGREGPTVQMGAAVARAVGGGLRMPRRTMAQLTSCGAGAGLAAAFNAPLAGVIFVIEEMGRELSALTLGGALVSAVCATVVTQVFTGQVPSFGIRGYSELPLGALPVVVLLGVAGGVGGVVFNRCIVGGQRWAQGLERVPRPALTALACGACGAAAWWMPEAVGGGHGVAEWVLGGPLGFGAGMLAALFAAKFVLTVVSFSSGAPGGIFAPMLLLGAVMGLLFGRAAGAALPWVSAHEQAFAVLGMAAFFTASVRAPMTGIVLILEMTANYEQLFALCVACLTAYLVADWLRDRPVYEALLEQDLRRRGMGGEQVEPTPVVIGVQRGSAVEGKRIREAGLPAGCLVVEVERSGRSLLPRADLELLPGDHVTVLVPGDQPEAALAVVDRCRSG